jgi:hypothetical protein
MIVRQKHSGGRPKDAVMDAYAERYGLNDGKKKLLRTFVVQFALCKTEECRRILLGISS